MIFSLDSQVQSETTRGRCSVVEQTLPKLPLVNPNKLNWRHLTNTRFLAIGK